MEVGIQSHTVKKIVDYVIHNASRNEEFLPHKKVKKTKI